ncbi:MAG: four-helix bundle copper-binding protein [Sediminibacterium sp.]
MGHEKQQSMIDAMNDCATECNHCISACLEEQDVASLARCIKLNIDCAELCTLIAGFVARDSAHAMHLMKECAEICNACAEECEKFADRYDHCKKCAEVCRTCAEECSAMA